MRILVITYEYPPIGGGGGHSAKYLCQSMARRGHEVRVVSAHMRGLPKQEELEGVRIIRLPSARRKAYQADLLAMSGYILAACFYFVIHLRHWKPDVVHVHFAVPSGPAAWFYHHLSQIPYVLTVHLGDVPGGVPEKTDRWFHWVFPFTKPIWRQARRVVAVSNYTRQLALARYPMDIEVIHNGIESSQISPGLPPAHNPLRLVFIGRFMAQKNPLQVVESLARLRHIGWECTMIGDGPLRQQVEELVRRYKLVGRICFEGWLDHQDVINKLSQSEILLMPSLSEGLPIVGIDALANGLAIIASRVGGLPELVEEGNNGYLIESGDIEGFAQAIQVLLTDRQKLHSFRQASWKKASLFDLDRITEAYERVFQQAIENRQ